MRWSLVFVLLLVVAPAWGDLAQQTEMLRQMFAQPRESWPQILSEHRGLLDFDFFLRVEQRIDWDLANDHLSDAIRFAAAGDSALQLLGRKPKFCRKLQQSAPLSWDESKPKAIPFQAKPAESSKAVREGRRALGEGHQETAERLFRQALVLNPKSATGWLELARFHQEHGKPQLAVQEYRQLTVLYPRNSKFWSLLAGAYEAICERSPSWSALDQARQAYSNSLRFRPADKDLLASALRLERKAKGLELRQVDLDLPGNWELQVTRHGTYCIGDAYGNHVLADGDPRGAMIDSGEWHPLVSLPGEALGSYLRRSYQKDETGDSELIESPELADFDLCGGLWRGHIVWVGSQLAGSGLWRGNELLGTVGTPIDRWPLGTPFARFQDRQTGAEFRLFRTTMGEIALEVRKRKVVAIYLMEPGRLRVNLQRLPRYRELGQAATRRVSVDVH